METNARSILQWLAIAGLRILLVAYVTDNLFHVPARTVYRRISVIVVKHIVIHQNALEYFQNLLTDPLDRYLKLKKMVHLVI